MKMVDRKASMENESNNNIVQKNDTNTTSEISSPIIDLEIQDIEGIGPTTAKKLKEAGIYTNHSSGN